MNHITIIDRRAARIDNRNARRRNVQIPAGDRYPNLRPGRLDRPGRSRADQAAINASLAGTWVR